MDYFTIQSAHGRVSLLNAEDIQPPELPALLIPDDDTDMDSQLSAPPSPSTRFCHVCGKIFTASGHLTRHLTIHTGVKAYTCPFPDCEKRCTRMDNLTQHFRIHLERRWPREKTALVRIRLDELRAKLAKPTKKSEETGIPPAPGLEAESSGSHSSLGSSLPSSPLEILSDRKQKTDALAKHPYTVLGPAESAARDEPFASVLASRLSNVREE